MKKNMRFAAMLTGAAMLCSAIPAMPASALHYVDSSANLDFGQMTVLDDRGMMEVFVYKDMFDPDTQYSICTYHIDEDRVRSILDPDTGTVTEEPYHVKADPLFIVLPKKNCLRFVVKEGLDHEKAKKQILDILDQIDYRGINENENQYYLKNGEVWAQLFEPGEPGIFDFFDYSKRYPTEEAKTAGAPEISDAIRNALTDAGLISEFYTWGETAYYHEIETGYGNLTLYLPQYSYDAETGTSSQISFDWEPVAEWVKEKHPECRFVSVTKADTELAKEIGFYNNEKQRTCHESVAVDCETVHAVIPPENITFPEHFALAAELYAQFGIRAPFYMHETGFGTVTGINALSTPLTDDPLTEFLTRIAGWDDAALDECIIPTEGVFDPPTNLTCETGAFYTPGNPYTIYKMRGSSYKITYRDGTQPDWDAILEKWKDVLREGGYRKDILEQFEYELEPVPASEEFRNVYFFRTTQDAWAQYTVLDVLKQEPDIEKIEAQFYYHTSDRINHSGSYSIVIRGTEDEMPDLKLENAAYQYDADTGCWLIDLGSESYESYFKVLKQIRSDGTAPDAFISFSSTELFDSSDDAFMQLPYETLFTRSDPLTQYYQRIAGWENTTLDQCLILAGNELLTPTEVYSVKRMKCAPYRFYLQKGTTLDRDTLLAKWKEMMTEAGYNQPKALDLEVGDMTIEEAGGGYDVRNTRDAFAAVTLADCLKTFPQVRRIETKYGYWTDKANRRSDFCFSFISEKDLTKADFPALAVKDIRNDRFSPDETRDTPNCWYLTLSEDSYAAYFKAAPYLQSLEFVHDLHLSYSMTDLALENDDALTELPYYDVLYDRGDVNNDGETDVSDAVMLARFCAEDNVITLSEQGRVNADADNSGTLELNDVTAILKVIAKVI